MNRRHALHTVAGLLVSAAWTLSASAETKIAQEIEVGLQSVDLNNPEAKFQEYKDVPQGLFIESYTLDVDAPKYDLSLDAKSITEEDRSATLSYDRGGKLWLNAGWDQTPHRWSETSRTLFHETDPGVYELPDEIQDFFQTNTGDVNWWNNIDGYLDDAHEEKLASRRDKASLGLGGMISDGLSLKVNFSHEKKSGRQLTPVALGRNFALEIARELDETVYDSGVALGYATKGMDLGLSYGLNVYENDTDSLTWDNFKRTTDQVGSSQTGTGSAQGRAAMTPDNLAHMARLTAGLDLPGKTRFNADINYTRMEQNEKILPYSINTAFTTAAGFDASNPANLPSERAETNQTLWVQDYRVANRASRFLSVGLKARWEQLGNHSKEMTFDGHTTLDQSWSTPDESTHRFTYQKNTLGGYVDANIMKGLIAGVDYDHETINRTHREYRKTEESTVVGRVNYSPNSWFNFRQKVTWANRDAKGFEVSDFMSSTSTFSENPGLRRYDIAARVRKGEDLEIQFMKGPFSIGWNSAYIHDEYKPGEGNLYNPLVAISASNQNKQYGLLENKVANSGIDLGLELADNIGIFASYQYSLVRGIQRQNQNNVSPYSVAQDTNEDYTVETKERYNTFGFGLDTRITEKVNMSLGYDLAHSLGTIDYTSLGTTIGDKQSVPETVSSKQDYKIRGEYKATKTLSLSLGYLFELYNVKDFAQDNVPLATGENITPTPQTNILLGDSSQDYKAHVVTLMAKYKF